MKILRKAKIKDKTTLRDFTKTWPPDDFCHICGKVDEVCKCEKLNCRCYILATNCKWPECLCSVCLEIICECKKNE